MGLATLSPQRHTDSRARTMVSMSCHGTSTPCMSGEPTCRCLCFTCSSCGNSEDPQPRSRVNPVALSSRIGLRPPKNATGSTVSLDLFHVENRGSNLRCSRRESTVPQRTALRFRAPRTICESIILFRHVPAHHQGEFSFICTLFVDPDPHRVSPASGR